MNVYEKNMVVVTILPAVLIATIGALFAVLAAIKWTRSTGGIPGKQLCTLTNYGTESCSNIRQQIISDCPCTTSVSRKTYLVARPSLEVGGGGVYTCRCRSRTRTVRIGSSFTDVLHIFISQLITGHFYKLYLHTGPSGWPVVGYMPYLHPNSLYHTMKYLIEKYGLIFKLRLGSLDTVVITEYLLIKKAFRSQELSHRPSIYLFQFASQGYHGI